MIIEKDEVNVLRIFKDFSNTEKLKIKNLSQAIYSSINNICEDIDNKKQDMAIRTGLMLLLIKIIVKMEEVAQIHDDGILKLRSDLGFEKSDKELN